MFISRGVLIQGSAQSIFYFYETLNHRKPNSRFLIPLVPNAGTVAYILGLSSQCCKTNVNPASVRIVRCRKSQESRGKIKFKFEPRIKAFKSYDTAWDCNCLLTFLVVVPVSSYEATKVLASKANSFSL